MGKYHVNKAIDKLKCSKTKAINFKTVAEEAGVSKATLYNNDVLKERILSLRAIEKSAANGVIIATPKDKIQAKDDKIKQHIVKQGSFVIRIKKAISISEGLK